MPDVEALARLHAACFTVPRPWSADEFAGLIASPLVFLCTESDGFLLGRVVADEAELLTLAVNPDQRRRGIGQNLVACFLEQALTKGATEAFLEVAANNLGALALYEKAGFVEKGRRKGYYYAPNGVTVDAVVMARAL